MHYHRYECCVVDHLGPVVKAVAEVKEVAAKREINNAEKQVQRGSHCGFDILCFGHCVYMQPYCAHR